MLHEMFQQLAQGRRSHLFIFAQNLGGGSVVGVPGRMARAHVAQGAQ